MPSIYGEILCRKCIEADIDIARLAEYLDSYVASLPDDIRASDAAYKSRLKICAGCPERREITCALCGCYIQARAAKRRQACPYDKGAPKWRAEDQS